MKHLNITCAPRHNMFFDDPSLFCSVIATLIFICVMIYHICFVKQMASSSSLSFSSGRERERQEPQPQRHPQSATSSSPRAPTGGGNRVGDNLDRGTIHGEGASSYQLPQYRHDAPWPRPRPSAEAAAKARAGRRARAERGASTPADARAEMEDKVCRGIFFYIVCAVAASLQYPAWLKFEALSLHDIERRLAAL